MSNENHLHTGKLDSFLTDLENHSIFENSYFRHLAKHPWTPASYELFRANFFYRTELTVKGIAQVCARSAAMNDMDTLILFSYILGEETGMGNKAHCHEIFMENALNLFGAAEYELASLKVQDAKNSPFIIPETLAYRERIQALLTDSYPRMLGVVMALETHADRMLTAFREAFRLSRAHLEEDQYKNEVEVYFNAHVDNGVEERHAEDARNCVINNCHSQSDLNEIIYGATEMFKAQQAMWLAMYRQAAELDAFPIAQGENTYA
ncbi:iron-containing redox enzyme family protein [Photobacterium sp. WH77]|uniref:iron-containing redox enzyme family protein n=1 Tax=Photobacterium TaxID=657 RepID=UPI001C465C52|nr:MULTISPECIES: iron-containing redox enzyme family protein [Photobacterium]MBV7263426.1 iron-containing redox enzyme family protein [Photobacterium sp. WH24]MCG2838088.1 iron-containing redox enzyme family protein [Photobacterium sp. WH77]MCG2845706.1 iron-containing redox enzyme family protein [Photobacterium sp. WH80]